MKIIYSSRTGDIVLAKTEWKGKVDYAGYDFRTGVVQTDRCWLYSEEEFSEFCDEFIRLIRGQYE